jgi:hypothetical protein
LNTSIETLDERQFDLYRPAATFPGLFQSFADTPATARGMCDFFNRFGPLAIADGGRPQAGCARYATSLLEVLLEQAALKRAIAQLDSGDPYGLSDLAARFNTGWSRLRAELRVEKGFVFVLVPASLIQFLWLQFALHAASDARLLRCERCSQPFRVGTGTGRRGTAKFCSNACKVAAFRRRHDGRLNHA